MDKKGFTLIEVVVASVILVIVFTTLSQIVVFSTTYFKDEYSESISQEDIRLTSTLIEKDIRRYVINTDYYSRIANETNVIITLGNTSNGTKYAKYTFNFANATITRDLYNSDHTLSSSQITSKQVSDFDVLSHNFGTNNPYLSIDIDAITDDRITNNDVYMEVFLRLPETKS